MSGHGLRKDSHVPVDGRIFSVATRLRSSPRAFDASSRGLAYRLR